MIELKHSKRDYPLKGNLELKQSRWHHLLGNTSKEEFLLEVEDEEPSFQELKEKLKNFLSTTKVLEMNN